MGLRTLGVGTKARSRPKPSRVRFCGGSDGVIEWQQQRQVAAAFDVAFDVAFVVVKVVGTV